MLDSTNGKPLLVRRDLRQLPLDLRNLFFALPALLRMAQGL